jgi:hypothetical protein
MRVMLKQRGPFYGYHIANHLCEDEVLAHAVKQDLIKRYPGVVLETEKCDNALLWAVSVLGRTPGVTTPFDCQGPISFYPIQVNQFLHKVGEHLKKIRVLPNGIRYAKMKTQNGLLCVRESTLEAAVKDTIARLDDIDASVPKERC